MLKKYQEKLSVVRLLFLLVLFIGGMVAMRYWANQVAAYNQSQTILDLRMGYSVDDCKDYLSALGAQGRALYQNEFFAVDFVYLLLYNAFYFSALLYLLRFIKLRLLRLVLLLPFCSLLLDLGENLLIRYIITGFPSISPSVCAAASALTVLKFISVYSSLAATAILAAVAVGKALCEAMACRA